MEGRDAASLPPSACPLQGGSKKEVVGGREEEGIEVALVHSLSDTTLAQLSKAALVLVLWQQVVQTLAWPSHIKNPGLEYSLHYSKGPSCEPLCDYLNKKKITHKAVKDGMLLKIIAEINTLT